jgi:MFS transporter, ACS family, pantothenate transporter
MGHGAQDIGPYSPDVEAREEQQVFVKPIKTWKGYIWDTWELPKDQRWLLFKLDAFVLTFASVSAVLSLIDKNTRVLIRDFRLATSLRISICTT